MGRAPASTGASRALAIVAELTASLDADRPTARVSRREEIADLRLKGRRTQGVIRLADALAKLGGGSLLSATLVLIINGRIAAPVVVTALLALFLFMASTIMLVALDRRVADLEHTVDMIEAALKETER